MKLKITQGKGFHVEFSNGITLSVQIGGGNYCDNRDEPFWFDRPEDYVLPSSSTAEIAIWIDGGGMIELTESDTVLGYVPVDRIFCLVPILDAIKNPTSSKILAAMGEDFT